MLFIVSADKVHRFFHLIGLKRSRKRARIFLRKQKELISRLELGNLRAAKVEKLKAQLNSVKSDLSFARWDVRYHIRSLREIKNGTYVL